MKAHEIQSMTDLLLFAQEHCKDPAMYRWFNEKAQALHAIIMRAGQSCELSIVEGAMAATRRDAGTTTKLRAIVFVYMVSPDCNPGWVLVFGEADDANRVIDITPRDANEPFTRPPRRTYN